jgi:hypothetical protein
MKYGVVALALALAAPLLIFHPGGTAAQDATEKAEDYPDFPGRDETFGFCTGCHGFKLVAAQGMDREAWDRTLTWMVERQDMADIQGEPRDLVLDYLTKAFPPKTGNQPGGWRNPFAQ